MSTFLRTLNGNILQIKFFCKSTGNQKKRAFFLEFLPHNFQKERNINYYETSFVEKLFLVYMMKPYRILCMKGTVVPVVCETKVTTSPCL
jgi:hypothetical protein